MAANEKSLLPINILAQINRVYLLFRHLIRPREVRINEGKRNRKLCRALKGLSRVTPSHGAVPSHP